MLLLFLIVSPALVFGQGHSHNKGNKGHKDNKENKDNKAGQWQMVGEKDVDRVKDWDDFYPKGNEIYSAFKLKILNSRVKFEKMVIVYDNGQRQEVSLKSEIPENGESRVIDVEGERRNIRKISFKYSTAGLFNDKAKVQVWGRK